MRQQSSMQFRQWLEVPYADKEAAKSCGARWDAGRRAWYAPRPDMPALQRWAGREPLPELLPGEDRSFGTGLFVDLIPTSCWFTNVRSCVAPGDWDRLRKMIYRRADQKCEACGTGRDVDTGTQLEAHERWHYDAATRVQRLMRLVCLCTWCHESTHFGFAEIRGHRERALMQLVAVNGWTRDLAEHHVRRAFSEWERRSRVSWTLDLSILQDVDVELRRPPESEERRRVASDTLDAQRPTDLPARAALPAAGWYPDPSACFAHRWWDGAQWTHVVAIGGEAFIAEPGRQLRPAGRST
ncbi:MAG: DUF2510 domain-containing protein [Mycolicibacterium frederiksbergense]|nr:DUF2510 domain-containing protein [Mycolicibacterium frederiksbergense]